MKMQCKYSVNFEVSFDFDNAESVYSIADYFKKEIEIRNPTDYYANSSTYFRDGEMRHEYFAIVVINVKDYESGKQMVEELSNLEVVQNAVSITTSIKETFEKK